jgi:hypothetical protein
MFQLLDHLIHCRLCFQHIHWSSCLPPDPPSGPTFLGLSRLPTFLVAVSLVLTMIRNKGLAAVTAIARELLQRFFMSLVVCITTFVTAQMMTFLEWWKPLAADGATNQPITISVCNHGL